MKSQPGSPLWMIGCLNRRERSSVGEDLLSSTGFACRYRRPFSTWECLLKRMPERGAFRIRTLGFHSIIFAEITVASKVWAKALFEGSRSELFVLVWDVLDQDLSSLGQIFGCSNELYVADVSARRISDTGMVDE